MKYRLIDKTTGIETLCDKVTIDRFDYYVSDEKPKENDWCIKEQQYYGKSVTKAISYSDLNSTTAIWKKVIGTNNPNIDIPKVLTVSDLANKQFNEDTKKIPVPTSLWYDSQDIHYYSFIKGYNKSQETHSFSEEDLISFAHFYFKEEFNSTMQDCKSTEEIFELWKEQQPKIVYYE